MDRDGRTGADGKLEIFSDDNGPAFSNTNDSDRIAAFENEAYWWWLRSPGSNSLSAAFVSNDGRVFVAGFMVINDRGVRPALWLNL